MPLRLILPVGALAASLALDLGLPDPARAQLAGSVALSSNEMFRGESISGNDPAASLALSLDGPGGLFAGASGSVAAGNGSPRVSSAAQYAGYALRKGRTSIEIGVIHRHYSRVVDADFRKDFSEGYIGVSHRTIKARIYVSPNYLRNGPATYYGEVNARLLGVGKWSLDGHAGLSLIPHTNAAGSMGTGDHQDWRLQLSRPLGKAFFSAGVAGSNYAVYSANADARAFASLSYAF